MRAWCWEPGEPRTRACGCMGTASGVVVALVAVGRCVGLRAWGGAQNLARTRACTRACARAGRCGHHSRTACNRMLHGLAAWLPWFGWGARWGRTPPRAPSRAPCCTPACCRHHALTRIHAPLSPSLAHTPRPSCALKRPNPIAENPRNIGSFQRGDTDVGTGLVGAPACGDVMKLQIKARDLHRCPGACIPCCHHSKQPPGAQP